MDNEVNQVAGQSFCEAKQSISDAKWLLIFVFTLGLSVFSLGMIAASTVEPTGYTQFASNPKTERNMR